MGVMPRSVRAWAELVRIPNLLTVPGDPLAGFFLAGAWGMSPGPAMAAVVSALLLYMAGMVLNDCADIEEDRRTRPERPLPSGRIAPRTALVAGWILLLAGAACAFGAGLAAGCLGLALAVAILSYDWVTKTHPWLGPLNMGLCRALSLLMGAAAGWGTLFLPLLCLVAAVALGAYILAVTRLARRETEAGSLGAGRWVPLGVQIVLLPVLGMLALSGLTLPGTTALCLLMLVVLSICYAGFIGWSLRGVQEPRGIQRGIGGFIHGLLFFQTAMAALGSLHPDLVALGALALIFTSRWLVRGFQRS
jgi:hypothetical protein